MPGTNSPEREAVKAAYSSQKWAHRVDQMSDSQVIAVYMRLKKQGKVY